MGDRQWPHPPTDPAFYEPFLSDVAPSPLTCPDCHDVVFPGATVCDGCGAHLNPERTPDGTSTD